MSDPDCTQGRLYSRMSFIYQYKSFTLTPFVKPLDKLNLPICNVFYIQLYVESAFTYPGSTRNLLERNTKCDQTKPGADVVKQILQ